MESGLPAVHIQVVSKRTKFFPKLRCPECGREGVAEVSEADGYSFKSDNTTRADVIPPGFRFVVREPASQAFFNLDIVCEDHDVSALVAG